MFDVVTDPMAAPVPEVLFSVAPAARVLGHPPLKVLIPLLKQGAGRVRRRGEQRRENKQEDK